MTIGERIRIVRKDRGFTQEQLANVSGLSASSIKYYELGSRNPKFETLKKIADGLHVTVQVLLGLEYFDDRPDDEILNEMDSIEAQFILRQQQRIDCIKHLLLFSDYTLEKIEDDYYLVRNNDGLSIKQTEQDINDMHYDIKQYTELLTRKKFKNYPNVED